ncbi:energy transducer TonB [Comamonas sp. Tr-654]|uniref:energy transducer TonB n=1 Tax=Comamonas sp. Tr-654 TaxID=2608341 RepID=UPI00141DFA5E|nr:energy transducer TonB [Comamonas sp. Tr-654]NIF82493.1 energy transducer TonB [Comamonas sp. Tr-654]
MSSTSRFLIAVAAVGGFVTSSAHGSEASISPPSRMPTPNSDLQPRSNNKVKVVVRVFVEADGQQTQAEVSESSGNPNIDKAALEMVAGWKFVPGKRDGIARPMWHIVPLNFQLN